MRATLLILFIAGLGLAGCGNKKPEEKKGPPPSLITVAQAEARDLEITEEAVGEADSTTAPKVAAEVAGRVLKVHVEVGDAVKRGQLLAELDPGDYAADARRLEAQAVTQQKLTERYRELARQGFISSSRLEEVEAQNVAAQEVYARAARNLTRTRIVAPISGRVDGRFIAQGDWIELGKPAFQLTSSERLRIRLPFPETVAPRIKPGQAVYLASPSAPDKPFTGKVSEVRPMVGSGSRAFDAIVEVDNPGDWKPGASVTGRVVVEVHPGAVMVPEQSVVLRPAGKVVYVVGNGQAIQRVVRTGIKERGQIEILEGLKAGETVAVDGAGFLSDRAKVSLLPPADKTGQAGAAK
ncbi:RND family efflux transporter MFP subunit [Sulfuritortus calidifontis]|uniref:RND family efflux transporter MFP subunit n=1 Tax=Sulfuritortus calidifontis TaxID=1914471 RepID=A0A4R3JXV5_9PROT|nr:efflux RND transporter periplasmic adaptor subunit [Sulfuritortus calidifontis]TCS72362.1 RND family efflux transporter MFP subunit [Sulfuritortus calidifontis]